MIRGMTTIAVCWAAFSISPSWGQGVRLLEQKPDPHGFPRPAKGAKHAPLRTSLYLELAAAKDAPDDRVDPESVLLTLAERGGEPIEILRQGQVFAAGFSGWLRPRQGFSGEKSLCVYVDREAALRPETEYTVRVRARSTKGKELPEAQGAWSFTTEAAPAVHDVALAADLGRPPVVWKGAFFSGFCNVVFGTTEAQFGPTYDLMADARKAHPRAWSLQRDFWMTGNEYKPAFLPQNLPNVVRERETRRIAAMKTGNDAITLKIEDVIGHAQYGVPADRPPSEDYHPGDEVLIADGDHSARAKVVSVDDAARAVVVSKFDAPSGGWQIAYTAPPPTKENPDLPGLFPAGGCYLRKHSPHGTPCYYWGRLDHEWDKVHRRYGRRLFVNFADAPTDLAVDGRNWTTVKDYVEWHGVVKEITGHLIDRYGDDTLDFVWSVFNEPDLGGLFWRTDWDELQKYYDYTTDAVLRTFEDRGLDSRKVFIGGLELGGIFGTNLRLHDFLAHCSPRAERKGALPKNAAVADPRLDGRRSRRVEELCRANGGKGSPCDFISIHSYNRSEMMAAKLIKAKEVALEIDAEYYRDLWVNSHESCPDWSPPPDTAAADAYLGESYFPTWCLDVARRQLRRAADDPRFAFGETILTTWAPNQNFGGLNAFTRVVQCDDDGDGRADRGVTIPMPIFHALNLLSDLGPDDWVLPEQTVGGHIVSGFVSRDAKAVRAVVYAHDPEDTQNRSGAEFVATLDLAGVPWPRARIREHRFDRDHNTYLPLASKLRDHPPADAGPTIPRDELNKHIQALESDDPKAQLAAIEALARSRRAVEAAVQPLFRLAGEKSPEEVRAAAKAALGRLMAPPAYPRAAVEQVAEQAKLRETGASRVEAKDGKVKIPVRLSGNGLVFLTIEGDDSHR